jgi:ribosomal protein L32
MREEYWEDSTRHWSEEDWEQWHAEDAASYDGLGECEQCDNYTTSGRLCSECLRQKAIDEDDSDLEGYGGTPQEGSEHEQ